MTVDEVRPAVAKFAIAMEKKLRKHDGDRGKDGWQDITYTPSWLFERLQQEAEELDKALNHSRRPYTKTTVKSIRREAVDVANFAMMIFDKMDEFLEERGP
jgi:NTP pyrophosphatase (non-canonical NTP hydrolase)